MWSHFSTVPFRSLAAKKFLMCVLPVLAGERENWIWPTPGRRECGESVCSPFNVALKTAPSLWLLLLWWQNRVLCIHLSLYLVCLLSYSLLVPSPAWSTVVVSAKPVELPRRLNLPLTEDQTRKERERKKKIDSSRRRKAQKKTNRCWSSEASR